MNVRNATRNFTWRELECRCGCGTRFIDSSALLKLQALREHMSRPLIINSAARCPLHNARIGGAPLSQHRSTNLRPSTAFDISLRGHDKQSLIFAAEAVGFGGIGTSYNTFLHVDDRGYVARW